MELLKLDKTTMRVELVNDVYSQVLPIKLVLDTRNASAAKSALAYAFWVGSYKSPGIKAGYTGKELEADARRNLGLIR